jgi:hypothetical protein
MFSSHLKQNKTKNFKMIPPQFSLLPMKNSRLLPLLLYEKAKKKEQNMKMVVEKT